MSCELHSVNCRKYIPDHLTFTRATVESLAHFMHELNLILISQSNYILSSNLFHFVIWIPIQAGQNRNRSVITNYDLSRLKSDFGFYLIISWLESSPLKSVSTLPKHKFQFLLAKIGIQILVGWIPNLLEMGVLHLYQS